MGVLLHEKKNSGRSRKTTILRHNRNYICTGGCLVWKYGAGFEAGFDLPTDNTRKYPCVVWICGGAWIQMDRSAHLAYLSVLAQQGFVVASVEYRTSNEAKFPAPLQDVKAGIRYLRAHADRFNIDPDRIGVMGESAGGYLTCMAALATDPVYDVGENLEYSSAVQAACPWYPPTDFRGFQYSDPEQCAASPESLLLGKNVMRHPGRSTRVLSGQLRDKSRTAVSDHPRRG